jgi:membrane protease YdiL (CAAX protease family)
MGARFIKPTAGTAIAVAVLYTVAFISIPVVSGIEYADWFDTAENAARTGIAGLVAGIAVLLAFLALARWDMLWRDPARLPMSWLLWTPPLLFVLVIGVRLVGIEWGAVSGRLLYAIVVAGVLVGFAEEMLFRGIFLRGMRTGGRTEGWAMLWTTIGFGALHLPNVFLGTGLVGLAQVPLAALTGVTLYLFRRGFGAVLPAMVAHGLWDISTFLDLDHGRGSAHDIALLSTFVVAAASLVALIVLMRRDRGLVVTPAGVMAKDSPHASGDR